MRTFLKKRLEDTRLYRLGRGVKRAVEKSLKKEDSLLRTVASLHPPGAPKGNVLISRVNDAFFVEPGAPIPVGHQSIWEAHQMAMVFLDLGYSVDVIHNKNPDFVPQKEYSVFLDARWNMERIGPHLGKRCVKILHMCMTHPLFQNTAELTRLVAVQQRRGVTLCPRRLEWPNLAIEHADCATICGNEFSIGTYRYANKPIYRLPIASAVEFPWPETKDFEASRKHFIWLGGGGMVHKGLDLILEAFAAMPQYHVTVCGSVEGEKDFVDAYHRELYETPNIHLAGWVDLSGPEFREIASRSVALIHPSCSEAGATSVVTCMHSGLIPIVSYESAVDVNSDWAVVLKACSVVAIQDAVRDISGRSAARLEKMARDCWEYARENHSREKFTSAFREVITDVVAQREADLAGKVDAPSVAADLSESRALVGVRMRVNEDVR